MTNDTQAAVEQEAPPATAPTSNTEAQPVEEDAAATPRPFTFTVDDAHAICETGIFRSKRVELVGGRFLVKEPRAPSHAGTIYLLQQRLSHALGEAAIVAAQGPLVLSNVDAPEPDIMVLAPREDFYTSGHPSAKDAYLVMEVANTSVQYDRSTKAALYAAAGICMYGIVDVNANAIHVYTHPDTGEYATVHTLKRGDTLALPESLPVQEEIRIPVADLFPTVSNAASDPNNKA